MTVREAQTVGAAQLERGGVGTPALDAALLLAHTLGCDRGALYARHVEDLPPDAEYRYRWLLDRRGEGLCVAYLVGYKEFRGLSFSVDPAVLVPRPDTETLVEAALDWVDRRGDRPLRVLDVCTGSGCVAIALKAERPRLDVSACDISEAALEVAKRNNQTLLPPPGVAFYLSDLLESVPGAFDLVVSNPPYIPSAEIDRLEREVRREPRLALDGGDDGLDLVRRLVYDARKLLVPGGRLLLEAGWDQSPEISRLLSEAGFDTIESYRDLGGHPRVTGGTLI